MKAPRLLLILTIMATSAVFALYHNLTARSGQIRIISPHNGDALSGNSVTIRYQLNHPLANSSSASYELRLDGKAPVYTKKTDYRFDHLSPGRHQIRLQLVAASRKDAPTSSTVYFSTSASGGAGELPETGSTLPLLSVIGFGVLLGGVASALRTR